MNTAGWGGFVVRPGATPTTARRPSAPTFAASSLLSALFHEATVRSDDASAALQNASLRRLDQSWRLAADNRGEVIVVGRVLTPPGAEGAAESPARLWLKGRPAADGGQPPTPAAGVRQETYVRLYLPVLPAGARP